MSNGTKGECSIIHFWSYECWAIKPFYSPSSPNNHPHNDHVSNGPKGQCSIIHFWSCEFLSYQAFYSPSSPNKHMNPEPVSQCSIHIMTIWATDLKANAPSFIFGHASFELSSPFTHHHNLITMGTQASEPVFHPHNDHVSNGPMSQCPINHLWSCEFRAIKLLHHHYNTMTIWT